MPNRSNRARFVGPAALGTLLLRLDAAAAPPVAVPDAAPVQAPTGGLAQAPDRLAHALDPAAARVGTIFQGLAARPGERSDWSVPLEQGRCYLFSGTGDAGIGRLALAVRAPGGARVAAVRPGGALVSARYCAPASGSYRVQLRVEGGRGAYALGTYLVAPPDAPPPPLNLDTLCEARAAAAVEGAQLFGPIEPPGRGAARSSWPLNLFPGTCYWLVGAGEPKVKRLQLLLVGPDGRVRAATGDASSTPALGFCPKAAGTYTLQARAGGEGAFRAAVYQKPQPPRATAAPVRRPAG